MYDVPDSLSHVSWDDALSHLAENLETSMFGAEGTVPTAAVCTYNDGNQSEYMVDCGYNAKLSIIERGSSAV